MRCLTNLFTALANLAASINALAGVLDVATGRLRQALALDDSVTALEHDALGDAGSSTNGAAKRKTRAGA